MLSVGQLKLLSLLCIKGESGKEGSRLSGGRGGQSVHARHVYS